MDLTPPKYDRLSLSCRACVGVDVPDVPQGVTPARLSNMWPRAGAFDAGGAVRLSRYATDNDRGAFAEASRAFEGHDNATERNRLVSHAFRCGRMRG